ncbi:MAG: hypothetical protein KatS3mg103_0596 [Phycisphaerales bacterium]|nr:MAG: hypothetical protein KatS3mg103_0596 [Phycisphaerales bacterium]
MRRWYGPGSRRSRHSRRSRANGSNWPGRLGLAPWRLGRRRTGSTGRSVGLLAGKLRLGPARGAGPLAASWGRAPARPVLSLAASLLVHAVLLGALALSLSRMAPRVGGGAMDLSLDLGLDPTAANPIADVRLPAPDDSAEASPQAQPEGPATAEDAQRRLEQTLDRLGALPADGAASALADDLERTLRGSAGPSGQRHEALLERGPTAGGTLGDLGQAGDLAATLDGASFAGLTAGRVTSVVYAVDASGAMVTSLPFVLDELRTSISALTEDQRFAVVLFGRRPGQDDQEDQAVRTFPPKGLLPATPANKARLLDWLQGVQARGISNPLDGLLEAIARQPEVVFLLSRSIRRTDGRQGQGDWGPGRQAILAELDRANPIRKSIFGPPRRAVQVKCVQFLEEDPTGVMRAIAQEHGGGQASYRLLTEAELRRR